MSFNESRKLPTFRFDENTVDDVQHLTDVTMRRYDAFMDNVATLHDDVWIPPRKLISSIVKVNTAKRQKAFLRAIEHSEGDYPPQTMISSIMNYGDTIPGVDDRYLDADYESHEIFAYNRLGKRSMLNRKFGEKCIEAMQYAYGSSKELGRHENLRARVHRTVDSTDERLAVISTKETIDRREYKNRTSLLVARVTGVARLDHDDIDADTREAIEVLATHDCEADRLVGAKALLADFIRVRDDSDSVVPVIQTIYQAQR